MIEKPPIGAPCNGCGLCCQIQVCSCGSYLLGLVERYGERAAGPCPVLTPKGDGFACGLILRPKDLIQSDRGVTSLREAVSILIGADAGCDEAGDEPEATAGPKIERLMQDYIERIGVERVQAAARLVYGGKK